jgi:hypothetical protein
VTVGLALIAGLLASDLTKLVTWASKPAEQTRIDLARALAEADLPRLSTAVLTEVLILDRKKSQEVGVALRMYPMSLRGEPAPARVLGALSAVPASKLTTGDRSIRDFLIGQALLAARQPRAAVAHLNRVAPGSPAYAPARFLMGVAHVTPPMKDLRSAGLSFKQAVVEAETSDQRPREVVQDARRMALLNLARLYHEVGRPEVALYYYHQLPTDAPERVEATFETAWVQLLRGDMHRALGAVHGARAPGTRHPDRAELHLVAAASLMSLCQHDLGRAELDRLKNEYLAHAEIVKQVRETARLSGERYVLKLLDAASPLPASVVQMLAESPMVRSAQTEASGVEAEMERLRRIAVDERIEVVAVLARGEGLKLAARARLVVALRDSLDATVDTWDRLESAYDSLIIDLLDHQSAELERQIRTRTDVESVPAEAQSPALGQDWQRWSFRGQWWPDELGYYRSTLPSLCAVRDVEMQTETEIEAPPAEPEEKAPAPVVDEEDDEK